MAVTVAQARTQISDRPQYYPPSNTTPEILGIGDNANTQFGLTYENFIPGTLTVFTAPNPAAGVPPVFTAYSAAAPANVGTTSAGAVAPGVRVVTPGVLTNIVNGAWLRADPGLATQEDVQASAVGGGTFTATFLQAHSAGFSIIGTPAYSVGAPSTGVNGTNATNQVVTFLAAPAAGVIVAARYQATAFSDFDLANYLAGAAAVGQPTDRLTLIQFQFDMIGVILGDQRRMELLSEGGFKNDPSAYQRGLMQLKESLRKDLTGLPIPGSNTPQLMVGSSPARRYLPRV